MEIKKKKRTSRKKKTQPKKSNEVVEKVKVEIEVSKLPDTPPAKNVDLEGWTNWYKETIRLMVAEGHTLEGIAQKLNIRLDSVSRFLK